MSNREKFDSPAFTFGFAEQSKCTYIEILQYPGLVDPLVTEGSLDDEALPLWLSKDLSQPVSPQNAIGSLPSSSISRGPTGGLRLLLGICQWKPHPGRTESEKSHSIIPFTKASFSLIEKAITLPQKFLKVLTGNIARVHRCSGRDPKENSVSGFLLRLGIFQPTYDLLFVSFSPTTKITHAILLSKTSHHIFTDLLSSLKSLNSLAWSQPLLLPVILTEHTLLASEKRIDNTEWKLNRSDEDLVLHDFIINPEGDIADIDGVKMTKKLNTIREAVTREQLRINAASLALEAIARYTDMIKGFQGDILVEEMIEHNIDACKNLLLRIEYQEKRVQSQTTVVYQFMAQKDSKVMMELAADSKRDSSAMKTISILGMFFLPGTFVAAIFAMPVFDWDETGRDIVKPSFKYYWAVAIPLTVLVLVSWVISILFPWHSGIARIRERLRTVRHKKEQGNIDP